MVEQTYVPRIEDTELKRSSRNGYWEIRWTIPADQTGTGRARTRTYSCRTKDKGIAEEVRRDYLSAAKSATKGLSLPIIGELIDAYLRDYVDAKGKGSSQRANLSAPKRLLGTYHPDDLDDGELLEGEHGYVATRTQEGVATGTIRRELGALKRVFTWAKSARVVPKDYTPPIINITPNGQERTFFLRDADEAKLHKTAEGILASVVKGARHPAWRGALFVILGLNTAARAEAIETLDWSRVDTLKLAKCIPPVSHSVIIDFRDPNLATTNKRRGIMPASDRLLPVLREEWMRQGKPTFGPVLGTYGSTRKSFQSVVDAAFGAGHPIAKELIRHDLRRTWATLSALHGVKMEKIAQVLADTLETTEKHYAHFAPDFLTDAVNKRA